MRTNLIPSIILLSILAFSCQDEEIEPIPTVVKPPINNISDTTAIGPKPISLPISYINLNQSFPLDKITNATFEISPEEWNILLENFDINPDNKEYIIGNIIITQNGVTTRLDSVGIRLKGNTSRRRPEGDYHTSHNSTNPDWHHAHFTINFKKYRKNQRYKGLEKMSFKWFKDDANYVREVYCYDLFERFGIWTAPQSSYTTLTIKIENDAKPANFGVYHMMESIDDDYLKNRLTLFGSRNGNLWKCSYPADLQNGSQYLMGIENITLDPNTSEYYAYDLKTNEENIGSAKQQLSSFIDGLNTQSNSNFKKWIESKMDVDFFLKTYAVSTIVGMWDDYWVNSNNYYIYLDPNNQFFFIPYDYDNTLGTSAIISDSGTQDLLNWGNSSSSPLISKILAIPVYRKVYINYLYDLTNPSNDYFHSDWSIPRIEEWQAMISPYVSNDTDEDMVINDYPAYWGNQSKYRLNSLTNNFFITRENNLPPQE